MYSVESSALRVDPLYSYCIQPLLGSKYNGSNSSYSSACEPKPEVGDYFVTVKAERALSRREFLR